MKSTDFRIGNLVYQDLPERNISTIEAVDLLAMAQCEVANHPVEFLEPIKLDEELLKKFGFNQSENWDALWLFKGNFGVHNHGGYWNWNDLSKSVRLEYVHHLQNLYFCLTGQELTLAPPQR